MRKHLILAVTVATLLVAGAPAFSAGGGGGGGGTSSLPDTHGRDYGFENMKADQERRATTGDELAIGADLVKQQKYADAIPHLELALAKKPNNAITLIYLGFSHRMIGAGLTGDTRNGEYTKALGYYRQALTIDPDNKLLHEYLGKLFLLMRDQTSAENELKTLETLCPSGCEERDTLSKVMLAYVARMTPVGASLPAPSPTVK